MLLLLLLLSQLQAETGLLLVLLLLLLTGIPRRRVRVQQGRRWTSLHRILGHAGSERARREAARSCCCCCCCCCCSCWPCRAMSVPSAPEEEEGEEARAYCTRCSALCLDGEGKREGYSMLVMNALHSTEWRQFACTTMCDWPSTGSQADERRTTCEPQPLWLWLWLLSGLLHLLLLPASPSLFPPILNKRLDHLCRHDC